MKARVDVDLCQGHSRCAMMYPGIFDVDDDAKAFVLLDEIPPESAHRAQMAAANCPERAIHIEE